MYYIKYGKLDKKGKKKKWNTSLSKLMKTQQN
jgi:hypothetical protein